MKHEINLWGFEPPNHRWDQDKNAKLLNIVFQGGTFGNFLRFFLGSNKESEAFRAFDALVGLNVGGELKLEDGELALDLAERKDSLQLSEIFFEDRHQQVRVESVSLDPHGRVTLNSASLGEALA